MTELVLPRPHIWVPEFRLPPRLRCITHLMSGFVRSPLIASPFVNRTRIVKEAGGGGLSMAGSITFNGTDEYLSIASFSSSSPDQKTFTISFWIKATNATISSDERVCDFGGTRADYTTSETIQFSDDANYQEDTSVISNIDAWRHIVLRYDSTEAAAADRVRMYVDNSEVSDDGFSPSLNADSSGMLANGVGHAIGADEALGAIPFDGKIADLIVVEGQSLAPSNFAFDNGGTWSWKDYTGTFGTHGFRINPQDSSEIGADKSGNGNDFTLNNMDTSNFDGADTPPT